MVLIVDFQYLSYATKAPLEKSKGAFVLVFIDV
jgi:hypothetical protein